jgi:ankyrin repeat protein
LRCCECAQEGDTPLHLAALKGRVACVALLVELGAHKEAKNEARCAAPRPLPSPPLRAASARLRLRSAALCLVIWRCFMRAAAIHLRGSEG